uniref:Ig-like domain-containing protein n=1 Tax=Sparus aurata TaxID=8175 RepID=A0A671Y0W5_SPAAU
MRNSTVLTALLLCSLSWISVSGSESQIVEVQSGQEVTLQCSNFSSAITQIIWFRVVSRSQPRCVSHMFKATEPAKLCDGFQSGKFEMRSNISTLFLRIKQVDSSDSGLYFCGNYLSGAPVIVSSTYVQVQEVFGGITKLTSVILGGLTVSVMMVVICLVLIWELSDSYLQNLDSDDLKDVALRLYSTAIRNRRPASEREVETCVIYSASR